MRHTNDECLICNAPLEYLEKAEPMRCEICFKTFDSTARCIHGHFVCDDCHRKGMDAILGLCLSETSKNPIEIIRKMMDMPFCHMHGPEHHVMVGAALLTAYRNAGGEIDLKNALEQMMSRGRQVPGGICGFWGSCGAAVSTGIFMSILTGSTPLAKEEWGHANRMTSRSLAAVAEVGGPRCCKRNSYLTIIEAVKYVKEHFGVEMELGEIKCVHIGKNNQCMGKNCPFCKK